MKTFLRYICISSEMLCAVKDNFDILTEIEILVTGRHCNLATFSAWLNDKYDLKVWGPFEKKYFVCRECGAIYYNKFFEGRNCNICGEGEIK
jgi:hypothetical protein